MRNTDKSVYLRVTDTTFPQIAQKNLKCACQVLLRIQRDKSSCSLLVVVKAGAVVSENGWTLPPALGYSPPDQTAVSAQG